MTCSKCGRAIFSCKVISKELGYIGEGQSCLNCGNWVEPNIIAIKLFPPKCEFSEERKDINRANLATARTNKRLNKEQLARENRLLLEEAERMSKRRKRKGYDKN